MTMQDFLVVGGGTVLLLAIFLVAGYLMRGGTLDVWGIVRRYVAVRIADEPDPPSSDEFPLLNDAEPYANGSENAAELWLNPAEVAALHRMIEHNKTAAKPSKSSTIQAGFGVSRGGSAAYQRASLIYDALFGTPAPAIKYRERTPEQEALRQQLRLEK